MHLVDRFICLLLQKVKASRLNDSSWLLTRSAISGKTAEIKTSPSLQEVGIGASTLFSITDTVLDPERKPPAKILLSTHETHYSSQSNAGIDPTAPALSPAELAILRRNRQAQENGRHHPYGPRAVSSCCSERSLSALCLHAYSLLYAQGLMIGRQMSSGAIPLPYQYRPPARPSPSMSTLQGSPALANAGTNVQHSTIRPPPTPVMAQMPVQSASPMLRTNGAPPHMAQEVRAFLQRQHQLMAPPQQRTASSPQPGQSSSECCCSSIKAICFLTICPQ